MLPILIVITFGSIDLAQYINTNQLIANASREGSRFAVRTDTMSSEDVIAKVKTYMSDALPQLSQDSLASALEVTVSQGAGGTAVSGSQLATVSEGTRIDVEVDFDFSYIRWLPGTPYQRVKVRTTGRRQ